MEELSKKKIYIYKTSFSFLSTSSDATWRWTQREQMQLKRLVTTSPDIEMLIVQIDKYVEQNQYGIIGFRWMTHLERRHLRDTEITKRNAVDGARNETMERWKKKEREKPRRSKSTAETLRRCQRPENGEKLLETT